MRKMMKTAIAALLLSGTALTPALAQDCTSPTRCDELGYTFSAEDCEGVRSLICPFDSSKYFCVEAGDSAANATPGMILYSDGTVSNDVVSGKTAVGIVAYVAGSTRFAVALEEIGSTDWGGYKFDYDGNYDYGYDVSCLTNMNSSSASTDFNGATNTQCLIDDSQSHPAAEYCNTYKPVSSGTGSSGWYLPAAGELYVMNFSYKAINLGLTKLSKTLLCSGDFNYNYYWSSSESEHTSYAWSVRLSDGYTKQTRKDYGFIYVRCVLAF